jgi:hypothetical protein
MLGGLAGWQVGQVGQVGRKALFGCIKEANLTFGDTGREEGPQSRKRCTKIASYAA